MKEYEIFYISTEEGEEMVGTGRGVNGHEAVRDFLSWHYDCDVIRRVRFKRICA